MLFVSDFSICLSDSFGGVRHLRNPMALIKTGPVMAIFQQNETLRQLAHFGVSR